MTTHTLRTTATRRAPVRGAESWHPVRRSIEMVAAALAGLLALTPVERLVWPELTARAGVGVLVLATNTSIGLAVWMRARGCSWRDVAGTAALVHLPFLALLVTLWAGEVGESAVLSWGHVVTVPAVALALLLRPVETLR